MDKYFSNTKESIPRNYYSKIDDTEEVDLVQKSTPRKYSFLNKSFGYKNSTSQNLSVGKSQKLRSRNNVSQVEGAISRESKEGRGNLNQIAFPALSKHSVDYTSSPSRILRQWQ